MKRRLEVRGKVNGVTVYDDFAHHPTAIATTIAGLRGRVGKERIIAVTELGSNTMRSGAHKDTLPIAFNGADLVIILRPQPDWGIDNLIKQLAQPVQVYNDVATIISTLVTESRQGDRILIMSNKGFGGIHEKLLTALKDKKS